MWTDLFRDQWHLEYNVALFYFDIVPLVITHNPNHAVNFSSIKSRINSVECPRLQRAFENKPLLSIRQPANLKRLLTRA